MNFRKYRNNFSNADISEPKFAINNEKAKIYITAKEGNFLNKDEILLKKMLDLNQMILVLKLKK